MNPTPPARLHVILGREAPLAVVIRRGPAKQVCTILWNRSTDEFTLGQWLKGRLYADRCDLSPDGRYFIYFAYDGRPHREHGPAWTAVSRAPWLKAIALYSKGSTWRRWTCPSGPPSAIGLTPAPGSIARLPDAGTKLNPKAQIKWPLFDGNSA